MSIDQLSQILDEIKGYVDDYKITKEENEQLKTLITPLQEQVSQLQIVIENKDSKIAELEAKVIELQEQANLNLVKAQEIVNELKEVINA